MIEIQRFAEGEEGAPVEEVASEPESKPESVDVEAQVTELFNKFKAQMDADYKKRAKEAERLGKLSDEERQKAELENVRKELDAQRAEFELEKRKYETAQVLSQRNLPAEFVDFVIAETSEATLNRIKALEKIINKAIEGGVNERLKGKAPTSSGQNIEGAARSSKSFASLIERNQIAR